MDEEAVVQHPRLRFIGRALEVLGLAGTFLAATGLGVVLHVDLPATQRLAGHFTEKLLSDLIGGHAHISRFTHIGITHVTLKSASLDDKYAHRVLTLSDVRVDLSMRTLAHDILFGHGRSSIVVDHVRAEKADAELLADPVTGEPTIVEAISPKKTAPPTTPAAEGAQIQVILKTVELGRVVFHARKNQPPFDARLRRVRGQLVASPSGLVVEVDRFGVVLRGEGLTARGTGTLSLRAPGPVRASFEGFVGDIEVRTTASIDHGHLDVVADLPRVRPDSATRVLPGWPLHETVSAHAEAHGVFPVLVASVSVQAGTSRLDASGPFTFAGGGSATLAVTARHVDARLFSPTLPATSVDLDATIAARGPVEAPVVEVHGQIASTEIGGQRLPATHLDGKLEDGRVTGTFGSADPGLPVNGSFHVEKTGTVDLDARTGAVNVSRIYPASPLRATASAHVTAHIADGKAKVTLDGDLGGPAVAGITAERAHVTAQATAPLDALGTATGSAKVVTSGVKVWGAAVDQITLDVHGNRNALAFTTHATLEHGPEALASGILSLAGGPMLKDTQVSFKRDPVTIEGTIASLDATGRELYVRDIHVTGAGGALSGSVRLRPDLVEIQASGQDVDLAVLSRAVGLPRGTLEGKMRIDADLATGRDVTRGRVRLGLGNATIASASGLSVDLTADLDGKKLTGGLSGLAAGLATFGATWNATLAGLPLEPASFRDVTGTADIQVGDVHLGLLGALLPKDSPVALADGKVYAHVLLDRKTPKEPVPNVFATVTTRGLVLEARTDPKNPAVRVDGIDLTATGAFDGATGDATGTALAADQNGDLFTTTAAVHTNVAHFVHAPLAALGELLDTPIDVVISVPRRNVQALPPLIRPAGVEGVVSGTGSIRGSLRHPTLFASVNGDGVAAEGTPFARPVDLHADAQYEWNTRALTARTTASLAGRALATAGFRGSIPGGPSTWTGQGRLDLAGLPLDLLFSLAKSQANGQLVGSLNLTRNGSQGTLSGDVRVVDPVVDHTPLGEGALHVETTGDVVHATLGFAGGEGTLDATASLPVSFAGAVPEVGHDAPIQAHVVAHDFVAIAFQPLVSGILTRVGGRFDADATVALSPSNDASGWAGGIQGKATLRDGSVLIDALGLEVKSLGASVEAHGSGGTTNVSIEGVHGSVRASKDNLHGSAGLVLDGVKLSKGTAELQADDMPILFRGAPQGRITGRASARVARQTDRMLVDVDLPTMIIALPQSSARQVIDLGENPDVTVLQAEKDESVSHVTPWRFALHLGSNVYLRRQDVELALTGNPGLDLGETAAVDGSVEISPGGRVPVLGKVFIVERGSVVFDTGDPSNPRVAVSATWRAPDDTIVYVDLTGTLRDAQIALRSDPPLPEPEVFALILGGASPDSTTTASDTSTQNGGAAAGAVALGGGVAALGLNQLLSNNPVEVRVDTTSQSLPRYTAAVRVRPNLWFEASEYQQTTMGTGGADRNVFSGVVDYRFTHRWSLRTEVGTAGGALDLLWQFRY